MPGWVVYNLLLVAIGVPLVVIALMFLGDGNVIFATVIGVLLGGSLAGLITKRMTGEIC